MLGKITSAQKAVSKFNTPILKITVSCDGKAYNHAIGFSSVIPLANLFQSIGLKLVWTATAGGHRLFTDPKIEGPLEAFLIGKDICFSLKEKHAFGKTSLYFKPEKMETKNEQTNC